MLVTLATSARPQDDLGQRIAWPMKPPITPRTATAAIFRAEGPSGRSWAHVVQQRCHRREQPSTCEECPGDQRPNFHSVRFSGALDVKFRLLHNLVDALHIEAPVLGLSSHWFIPAISFGRLEQA